MQLPRGGGGGGGVTTYISQVKAKFIQYQSLKKTLKCIEITPKMHRNNRNIFGVCHIYDIVRTCRPLF